MAIIITQTDDKTSDLFPIRF